MNPPPLGVDGVEGAVAVFGAGAWGAGEGKSGMCNFGVGCGLGFGLGFGLGLGLKGAALEPSLELLNVMRGGGGAIAWSSRLRLAAVESFDGASAVRILLDRKKCNRPYVVLAGLLSRCARCVLARW